MSALQEKAVRMIGGMSDDNLSFLIEIMQKIMHVPEPTVKTVPAGEDSAHFMDELELMRKKTEQYFTEDFDEMKIWEEAMNQKYGDFD